MPRSLFQLFNHTLTDAQRADAETSLGISRFVTLPAQMQALWSQVPPELPSVQPQLAPVIEWLLAEAQPEDVVLVQGDFGATFWAVDLLLARGLRCVYATTTREASEQRLDDGSVVTRHHFRHVGFRPYEHADRPR